MSILRITLIFLFAVVASSAAEARRYRAAPQAAACQFPDCGGGGAAVSQFLAGGPESPATTPRNRGRRAASTGYGGQIVGHPPGCPRRAFCGCGAAVRVFGQPIRSLWLAAAWFKFPRAAPAPGMVAVRRGHVFVLESHVDGNTWIVFDANSGGRQTRIHARSIAGYLIVNPRA